jgi:hypothetical protein
MHDKSMLSAWKLSAHLEKGIAPQMNSLVQAPAHRCQPTLFGGDGQKNALRAQAFDDSKRKNAGNSQIVGSRIADSSA